MIMRLCAVGLLTAIVGTLLTELGFRSRRLLSLLALVILFSGIADRLGSVVTSVTELSSVGKITDAVGCVVKTVGAGYLFGFCSDVCTELGEPTLAKALGIAGRVEIFIIAFPFFEKTIKLGLELLQ